MTNSETDSNVQETIMEVIKGDVNAVISDDGNAGNKEVPDLLMQEIQIFGKEVDSNLEISEEEDKAFAATLCDESYPYKVYDLPPLDESNDCKREGQPQ